MRQPQLAPVCISLNIDTIGLLVGDHGTPIWESLGRTDGRDDCFLTHKCYNRTYGLRYPVCYPYMCSPSYAIPNPLVWQYYMCINNQVESPSHPLLLSLSGQSSSFNACNRGAHNQPILWVSLVGRSTASFYNMVAVQIQRRRHTTNTRPHTRNALC